MSIRWDSLRTRYDAIAINVAAGVCSSRDEARSIVDSAFDELSKETRDGNLRIEDVSAARNALLERVRKLALAPREVSRQRPNSGNALGLRYDPSDPELERASRRHGLLEAALFELDPDSRRIFELRFREHQSRESAARILGVPLPKVQTREHALLEKMRHAADAAGGAA